MMNQPPPIFVHINLQNVKN